MTLAAESAEEKRGSDLKKVPLFQTLACHSFIYFGWGGVIPTRRIIHVRIKELHISLEPPISCVSKSNINIGRVTQAELDPYLIFLWGHKLRSECLGGDQTESLLKVL